MLPLRWNRCFFTVLECQYRSTLSSSYTLTSQGYVINRCKGKGRILNVRPLKFIIITSSPNLTTYTDRLELLLFSVICGNMQLALFSSPPRGIIQSSIARCDMQASTEGAKSAHLSHYISHCFHYVSRVACCWNSIQWVDKDSRTM